MYIYSICTLRGINSSLDALNTSMHYTFLLNNSIIKLSYNFKLFIFFNKQSYIAYIVLLEL